MCVACPAKVLKAAEGSAEIVDAAGRRRTVSSLIAAKPGDYVLIGMGYAVDKISKKDYDELAKAY